MLKKLTNLRGKLTAEASTEASTEASSSAWATCVAMARAMNAKIQKIFEMRIFSDLGNEFLFDEFLESSVLFLF